MHWQAATSGGAALRTSGIARRHPLGAKGIGRVSRYDANAGARYSDGRTVVRPRTFIQASLSCHTRNVSNNASRSASGTSLNRSNAVPADLTIISGALTAAVARIEPSKTATGNVRLVRPCIDTFWRSAARAARRADRRIAH